MRRSIALVLVALGMAQTLYAGEKGKVTISKSEFGKLADGTAIDAYTLKNSHGMSMKVITYGGIITELHVPDKDGKFDDVCLGFDNLKGYLDGHPYFGAITGRYCNRIANGKFTLDGKEYTLAKNNGENHLHGGIKAFDKVVWKATPVAGDGALKLTYRSPDGEEGYPGNLDVTVTYTLTDKNELRIDYLATTDKATPINLTNHAYFNLGGITGGKVLSHELMIPCEKYTPTDASLIPTGKIEPVEGTPFDFRTPKAIGKDIGKIKTDPVGYDLNYVLDNTSKKLVFAARVTEAKTGRVMEVHTTEPAIQFYTGNFLDGKQTGKGGVVYKQYQAFCLETQHYPDSPNQPNFPSTILKPGEKYESTTVYTFKTK